MLTPEQRAIVKSTVPLLETGGEALTTHFYKIMLAEHPEVRPFFNQAHQANGDQPRALANGVLMYARNIDRLEQLGGLVNQIIQKHVSLQIEAAHYPVVGGCLLRAIREVLGADIATDEVIAAWAAAYQQLADILIGAEEKIYADMAAAPGGWRGGRAFRVARKVRRKRRDHLVLPGAAGRRRAGQLRARPVHRPAPGGERPGNPPQLFAVGRAQRQRLPHQRQARAGRRGLELPA